MFKLKNRYLSIDEIIFVKYDNLKKGVDEYTDRSLFSFVIPLNNDFEGGGTMIVNENKIIKPDVGNIFLFCGQNKHSGVDVVKGTRYVLVGFINHNNSKENSNYTFEKSSINLPEPNNLFVEDGFREAIKSC